MKSDSDLLRSYVENQSGEAFTEIVRRNVSHVHSSILRRVGGDTQIAEDITQEVFSDLARKAPRLAKLSSVTGWLYVGANLASAEYVRKERRRKTREGEASRMQGVLSPERTYTHDEWSRIRDLIDDLICELNNGDREALILRFFSKRTYLEIAGVQSTTEEGVRKRVDRAVEKLRLKLAKSGITSSMEALEAVLVKQPDTEISGNLADRVASIAVVEFGATGAATSWLLSLVRVLTSKGTALGAVFVASAILIAWQHHINALMLEQMVRLQGQPEEIRKLEQANLRLSRKITEAEDLRRILANISSRRSTNIAAANGMPVGTQLHVEVTAEGRILWENEPVDLKEFLNRLVVFHAQDPASGAQLVVNGAPGAAFSATAYVVEQASKAGFHNIVINSQTTPTAADDWVSVEPVSPRPEDMMPPMLPDATVKP